ncbi:glycosyltransferase family 39 protein [Rhizobium sp. CF080]|uniref:glycosyltransferase family 39 protein n=1 Tax=Rhizobium sp. (strain CF080) TaxID=1144310 RepID=UPI000271667A|nr:glycosyltransferase family 39 protein [Rhizobium sp. CF080]
MSANMDAVRTAYQRAMRREDAAADYEKSSPKGGKPSSLSGDTRKWDSVPILLVALITAGIVLRILNLLLDASLWEDEVFSVALAESPLIDLLFAALRFDTHPPLYYVQLHLWAAFGDSDRWYILNSTLLSVAAIVAIYEACRRIYDRSVALWAGAIFAVMPLQLFFAENVRMYPMLAILEIGLWYVLQAMVRDRHASKGRLIAALCLGLAVTLTHGLGFFVAFFLFLHAAIRLRQGAPGRDLLFLIATYVVVALAALYPLVIGAIRQTEGIAGFDLPTIGIHLTLTLLGLEFPWPTIAGFLILPLLTLLPLSEPRARWIGGALVFLPFLVLLAISLLAKPVFIYRTLGLFLPFLAISLALYADAVFKAQTIVQRIVVSAIALVMLAGGINYTMSFEKRGYREIVAAWEASSPADAVIMTNGPSEFWAVMRYLNNGEGRRSALEIQAPVRDGMLRIKQKLEGMGAASLGLFGRLNYAQVGGRRIYPYLAEDVASDLPAFWILNPPKANCILAEAGTGTGVSDYQEEADISLGGNHLTQCRNLRL